MPELERWNNLPEGVRQHLIEWMRDRKISVSDLNRKRSYSGDRSPRAKASEHRS